jgi:hypothetical protein
MMDKWRHSLEPLILDSLTPIPWDEVKKQNPILFESENSVLLCTVGRMYGEKSLHLTVAAGKMNEVDGLYKEAELYAKQHGFSSIAYAGRRGWLKTHGFKEVSVIGYKEI